MEEVVKAFIEWVRSKWPEILRHSAPLRYCAHVFSRYSNKLGRFVVGKFFPIVVALAIVLIASIIVFPFYWFGDRCYISLVNRNQLTDTRQQRTCRYGDPIAFYIEGLTDRPEEGSILFTSAIFSAQGSYDQWFQVYDKGHQYVLDPDYAYINFRFDIVEREAHLDLQDGTCNVGLQPQSQYIVPRLLHRTYGIRLRSTEPRGGLDLPADERTSLTLHEIVRLLFSFFNELQLQGI